MNVFDTLKSMKSGKKLDWMEDLKKVSSRNVSTPVNKLLARRNHQNKASGDQNIREKGKTQNLRN